MKNLTRQEEWDATLTQRFEQHFDGYNLEELYLIREILKKSIKSLETRK